MLYCCFGRYYIESRFKLSYNKILKNIIQYKLDDNNNNKYIMNFNEGLAYNVITSYYFRLKYNKIHI